MNLSLIHIYGIAGYDASLIVHEDYFNEKGEALRKMCIRDRRIAVQISCHQGLLTITVSDDGPGFPQRVLNSKDSYAYMGSEDENHLGMGLSICRVLCRKHGGKLILSNAEHGGAVVKFTLLS